MNIVSILFLGLLLGIRHATDADHVVAVTTLVARHRRISAASLIGVMWGVGHTITIFIVGVAIIVFHLRLPPRLGLFFEFLVALTLMLLGILNLTGVLQRMVKMLSDHGMIHAHLHFHGDQPHVHVHRHKEEVEKYLGRAERLSTFIHHYGALQLARPLVVGFVHGLAGSAAITLLVLGSITRPLFGVIYLLVFGIGTAIGMVTLTTVIGFPVIHSAKKYAHIDRWITGASGLLSIIFGLYLAYHIAVVGGLFRASPNGNPY